MIPKYSSECAIHNGIPLASARSQTYLKFLFTARTARRVPHLTRDATRNNKNILLFYYLILFHTPEMRRRVQTFFEFERYPFPWTSHVVEITYVHTAAVSSQQQRRCQCRAPLCLQRIPSNKPGGHSLTALRRCAPRSADCSRRVVRPRSRNVLRPGRVPRGVFGRT